MPSGLGGGAGADAAAFLTIAAAAVVRAMAGLHS